MHDTHEYEQVDRRVSVRRKEDYFWLKRLADLTGEACLAVNRDMRIEYVDEKIFDLLQMDPVALERLPSLNALTKSCCPAMYATTRASIWEESQAINTCPSGAVRALRIIPLRGRFCKLSLSPPENLPVCAP